jgi:hypothetical protein
MIPINFLSFLRWIFLEVLGSLVLLGVIFIDAKSRRMELAMCELTIFSVSMLCYVLADLDSPFNGFFRVDLGVLPDVIKRIEYGFNQAKTASRGADGIQMFGAGEQVPDMEKSLVNEMMNNQEGQKQEEVIQAKPPTDTSLWGNVMGLKKRSSTAIQEDEALSETALSTLSIGDHDDLITPRPTPRGSKKSTGPGAHGVISVNHSGRRSALSLETTLTDVQ